ncbi:hypothetical protein QLQ86_06530 [Halomonas sp. LR5S13]|uniref:hypothetical protein n=1 Tax=Halomonas rhizosphaerae TaxID=3043296 RepID=UPI0024A92FB2|nr:hypothetical protein [Halomonas rhizosphaerae]MDI5920436.1 hypothetical protein [Halomonas rhizosphaerae]
MRVNYLGPLCAGISHPALEGYDLKRFKPTCYLVEVSEEAGVFGPLREGDLLVVDEQKPAQHADLVIGGGDREGSTGSSCTGRCRALSVAGGFRRLSLICHLAPGTTKNRHPA